MEIMTVIPLAGRLESVLLGSWRDSEANTTTVLSRKYHLSVLRTSSLKKSKNILKRKKKQSAGIPTSTVKIEELLQNKDCCE
jgi:hypothetical protein